MREYSSSSHIKSNNQNPEPYKMSLRADAWLGNWSALEHEGEQEHNSRCGEMCVRACVCVTVNVRMIMFDFFWELKFLFFLLGQPKKVPYTHVSKSRTNLRRCVLTLFFSPPSSSSPSLFCVLSYLSASSIFTVSCTTMFTCSFAYLLFFACNSVRNDFGHFFFASLVWFLRFFSPHPTIVVVHVVRFFFGFCLFLCWFHVCMLAYVRFQKKEDNSYFSTCRSWFWCFYTHTTK